MTAHKSFASDNHAGAHEAVLRMMARASTGDAAAYGADPWTQQASFRAALAATLAKSPEDRRVFDLVFERFFFRAVEREAIERGITEGDRPEGQERMEQSEAFRRAIEIVEG